MTDTVKDGGLARLAMDFTVDPDEMRHHAEYLENYSEPFTGSTDLIARALHSAADQIETLAARGTPQPDPVREELVKSIEMLREMWSIVRGSTGDVVLYDFFESELFPEFDRKKHGYDDLARWTHEYVDAALSRAKEGTS